MLNNNKINENRKWEHLKLIYEQGMQSKKNWMDEVILHPDAIPFVDYDDVSTSCMLFGERFAAPFLVAAMTGGHPRARQINEILAMACSKSGVPLGLGSQRVGMEDEELIQTYRVARDISPDLFLLGNIGMSQLVSAENPVTLARECVDMIDANGLVIHFNKLQELIQPEGDRIFATIMEIVSAVKDALPVPVILKEVGMGFSERDSRTLNAGSVDAIDIGGFGGTNFSLVEAGRITNDTYPYSRNPGNIFQDCGTPTPISIYFMKKNSDLPVIATGGIRTGLDVVKTICIGASMAGIAYPFLLSSMDDLKEGNGCFSRTVRQIDTLIHEIRIAMVLLNARSIDELDSTCIHFTGNLSHWVD